MSQEAGSEQGMTSIAVHACHAGKETPDEPQL